MVEQTAHIRSVIGPSPIAAKNKGKDGFSDLSFITIHGGNGIYRSAEGQTGPVTAGAGENEAFLTRQLITCIGNKRSLLGFIGEALEKVKARLGKKQLRLIDLFSGSGAAARLFKQYAELLLVNDIEAYSETIGRCYLANPSALPLRKLRALHEGLLRRLREEPLRRGFIAELYAPADEENIKDRERAFYTPRNARFIDTARQYIDEIDEGLRPFFIAPLLSEASVHANTAGVFKGFYKDSETGRGHFGGKGADALSRIKGDITLPFPVWSNFECPVEIYREDANTLARRLPELDAAYLDPPYNQHPYGSNYFMLNLICSYRQPEKISPVSGIPPDWNRSDYNKPGRALAALAGLAADLPSKFLLISFNSEGFIDPLEMEQTLKKIGRVGVLETPYNVFRGSRNLKKRGIHVKEYLFIVEKK